MFQGEAPHVNICSVLQQTVGQVSISVLFCCIFVYVIATANDIIMPYIITMLLRSCFSPRALN